MRREFTLGFVLGSFLSLAACSGADRYVEERDCSTLVAGAGGSVTVGEGGATMTGSAAGGGSVFTDFDVSDSWLWDSSSQKRLGFSEVRFKLERSHGAVAVEAVSLASVASATMPLGPTILADRVPLGTMTLPISPGIHRQTFDLPDDASELVVRNGPAMDNPTGVFVQSYATKISLSGATPLLPVAPAHRIVVYGDSVSNGFNASVPGIEGWTMRLRATCEDIQRVSVYGCGGYALAHDAMYTEPWATLPTRLAALLDGTRSNTLIMAVGINDAMGYSEIWGNAEAFGAAYGDLADRIHEIAPSAAIAFVAMHTCTNSQGSSEPSVSPYRDAIRVEAAARPWAMLVDMSTWRVAMDDSDWTHLHPSTTGHFDIATNLEAWLRTHSRTRAE